jgi:hypothetical protein
MLHNAFFRRDVRKKRTHNGYSVKCRLSGGKRDSVKGVTLCNVLRLRIFAHTL